MKYSYIHIYLLHVSANHVAILRGQNTKDDYKKGEITQVSKSIHTYKRKIIKNHNLKYMNICWALPFTSQTSPLSITDGFVTLWFNVLATPDTYSWTANYQVK
jgi:hypothetical protein